MKRAMRMLVVSMVAVLAIASVGSAKNTTWNNAALDGSYTNSANWDLGAPVAGDVASFTWTSDTAVISTDVYTESLAMGIVGGVPSNLKIVNGGYGHFGSTAPTYGSSAISSTDAACSANLTVEAGGTADFAWQLTVGQWGNGKVTLNGGTLKVQHLCFNASGGGANSSGLVDVQNGGTLQVNTQFIVLGWNAVGPVMNVAGAGSKILVKASAWDIGAANAWANAGFLTGNGLAGAANIVASTVDIGGVAYTQVTAVPEPVTLALLAAGGLFLRRKA